MRAAGLRHTNLTDFVLELALREADAVIEEAEWVKVSERDYVRVLDLLKNPSVPNNKLRVAATALPRSI